MIRRINLIVIGVLFSIMASAQITGVFLFEYDSQGNGYPYFKGDNVSGYNINIKIDYFNRTTGELQTRYLNPLNAGGYFTIGVREDWIWQPGEVLMITYPNGQSVYWVYGKSSKKISFTGSGHCTANGHRCVCLKFVTNASGNQYCKTCTHNRNMHVD